MEHKLTEEQQQFLQRTMERRKEKVEELAGKMLALSITANIPMWDLPYYVVQRAQEVIQDAYATASFKNKKLQKARKEFLKVCLEGIKKNVKTADKLPPEHVKDATEIRDEQCEPLAQELANLLLDRNLIFSDEDYFDDALAEEEAIPLKACIWGYMAALDEKLLMIVSNHWMRAIDKLWGVDKDMVTFSQIDEVLKRP